MELAEGHVHCWVLLFHLFILVLVLQQYKTYTWYYQAEESEALAARQLTAPVEAFPPVISVIVNPPSPVMSDDNDEVSFRFSEDNMNRCEHPVYICR